MRRDLFIVVMVLVMVSCTQADSSPVPSSAPSPSSMSTSTSTTSSTTVTTTTSTSSTTTTTTTTTTSALPSPTTGTEGAGPGPLGVTTYRPEDPTGSSIVVLVHGGGWVAGTPVSMEGLATDLAEEGALVFNASYRTARNGGGYPSTFDDVACAIRFARARGAEMGTTGPVTVVGHSAGAHLAAVVALSNDEYGKECPWDGSSTPDRLVGMAGIYQPQAVVPIMILFLGGDQDSLPDAWEAVDPFLHLSSALETEFVLLHGTADRIALPATSEVFAEALLEVGADVTLELIEGATHNDVLNPDISSELVLP